MKKKYEVIQEEISDCGICSLACIIKYYGGNIPLEMLRINTNTDHNGTNALELVNCAKKYGFNSYGEKIEELKEIKKPVIAHLYLENSLYHFVVVYKIKNNNIYIMDPATGLKRMNLDKFNELFTGVLLYFEPINIIPSFIKNNFIHHQIKEEIKNNKNKYFNSIILSSIILITTLVLSLEIKLLNINKNYIYFFLLLIIFNEILIYIKNINLIKLSINFNNKIIRYFINHIFKLPSNYLKLKRKGEITSRFNELNELGIEIINFGVEILFIVFLIIFLFIITTFISIKTSLTLVVFTIIYVLFNIRTYKKLFNYIKYSINIDETCNSNIIDYISNIETIKNINRYSYFKKNIFEIFTNKMNNKKSMNSKLYKIIFINNIFTNIILLLILYIIINEKYNVTNSLTLYIIINYFIENIKMLINYLPTYYLLKTIILKNNDFLSYKENEKLKFKGTFNELKIKNLTYKINNISLLNNINLSIKKNDKIFINGPSGIGKSTLMRMINNEIQNYNGNILKDNINIKEYDVSNLISYVNQDSALFDDNIYNNIVLDKRVDEVELNNIIKICRLDNLIENKDAKLDSIIINNSNISGGEKNRIILARSLIHSKEIIILDEVLKEVDLKLEIKILKDILNYYKNKTIIYISHKNVGFLFSKTLTLERSN